MKEAQEFQVGDIVEVLAIVALQRDLYLPKDADWRQFIGKQYRVSFVGKMVELEGFPPCRSCSSVPTPFYASQLRLMSLPRRERAKSERMTA